MKTAIKTAIQIALVGAALVGGAAQAQIITNNATATGGSDLVLVVSDLTTNTFFAQDISKNPLLDSAYSKASVVADGVLTTDKNFNATNAITTGHDAALATFLASTASTDTVDYSVMASDHTSTATALGSQRGLFTSTIDLTGGNPIGSQSPTFTNGNVSTFSNNFSTFAKNINSQYTTGNTSTVFGWGDQRASGTTFDGKNAPNSWISASVGNGAAIGTTQSLFLFATNGTGLTGSANVYTGGTINIDAAADITYTPSTVPLPAAVWLFGSGLLGLIGVGRRRNVAA